MRVINFIDNRWFNNPLFCSSYMNKEELYERIKDRKASDLFGDLEYQLDLIPPNGAKIHKLITLRHIFGSEGDNYSRNIHPINETIAEYNKRDSVYLELIEQKILESMQLFGVHL
ncbi:MAG: hypothetical protein AABW47_04595 [Nanoarchaeota archaeon]